MDPNFPDALELPRKQLRLRGRSRRARPSAAGHMEGGSDANTPVLAGGGADDRAEAGLTSMMDAVSRGAARALDRLRADPGAGLVVAWSGLELRGDQGDNGLPSAEDESRGRTRLLSFTRVRPRHGGEWALLPAHRQLFVSFRP